MGWKILSKKSSNDNFLCDYCNDVKKNAKNNDINLKFFDVIYKIFNQ